MKAKKPMKIHVANPHEKQWTNNKFVLWFGAYGATHILAYGQLEEALEAAAEYCVEQGWFGLVTPHDSKAAKEMFADARDELGPVADESEVFEHAMIDHTYTESGVIASWEWGITIENPTKADLIRLAKND